MIDRQREDIPAADQRGARGDLFNVNPISRLLITHGKETNMSILPEGEQLRKAVKWLSDQRTEQPSVPLYTLIEKACLKFDLTPKDEEFLMKYITEGEATK